MLARRLNSNQRTAVKVRGVDSNGAAVVIFPCGHYNALGGEPSWQCHLCHRSNHAMTDATNNNMLADIVRIDAGPSAEATVETTWVRRPPRVLGVDEFEEFE